METFTEAQKRGMALVGAASKNKVDEMKRQLRMGAEVDYVVRTTHQGEEVGMTSLAMATLHGHLPAVNLLIESGADVNRQESRQGMTALHTLSREGKDQHHPVRVMELLISKGAEVDKRDNEGHTPLYHAAGMGHKEAALFLLDHGANVNAAKNNGFTPLMIAVQQKQLPLVDLLLLREADPNLQTKMGYQAALHMASSHGHLEIAERLLKGGATVDQLDKSGLTPLDLAIDNGHHKVIKLLISKGAKIRAMDNLGRSSIHQATTKGHREAARCLLDHGADINAADNLGVTPLMIATQQNCFPESQRLLLVDIFLQRGADPNLSELTGRGALHYASWDGYLEIADRLLEGGASVDKMDKRRFSPLHLAAQRGHLKVVKLLLKKGANANLLTVYGMNSLHLAILYGKDEVADYLIKKGANLDDQGNAADKACKYCGATDVPAMMKCSGCKVVCYCGPDCQKKDWKEGGENKHKLQCPRIKEQRDLYKEKKKEEAQAVANDLELNARKGFFDGLQRGDPDAMELAQRLPQIQSLLSQVRLAGSGVSSSSEERGGS